MAETDLVRALRSLDRPVVPSRDDQERIWQTIAVGIGDDASEVDAGDVDVPPRVVGGTRVGKGWWRMAAAAVVVLAIGLTAVWFGGTDGRLADDGPATDESMEEVVELPDSHPAAELLTRGADDITTFSDMAQQRELAFQCVAGGMTQVCLVYAEGLVAVVPLAAGPGFTMTVSGRAVDEEVTVPLDEGALAIPGPGGRFTAVIEDNTGERVAGTQGGLFEPHPPPGGHKLREPVISGAEDGASYAVGTSDTGLLCAEAASATESLQSCGRDTLSAVAFQAGEHLVVAGYVSGPVGTLTAVLDDDERYPLELTPVPGQEMFAFGLIRRATTGFVGIEVRDEDGEIIKTYFPSLGPIEQ